MITKRIRKIFRVWFHQNQVEQELGDEMQFHLEHHIEMNIASGMTPEEARYRAVRDFGGVAQVQEACRDTRRTRWIQTLWQDARYGARMLRRNPGFAAAAVATLALGIGVNGALLSIAHAVLVRPLPYYDSHRLVQIYETAPQHPESHVPVTPGDFFDLRSQLHSIRAACMFNGAFNWTGAGDAVRLEGATVSVNFFDVAGVDPILGRRFRSEEETPGKHEVVLIGHGLWKRAFGMSPDVLGRTMILDGRSFTVIGVLPPDFYLGPAEVFVPYAPNQGDLERFSHFLGVVGRLAPGIPMPQAQSELNMVTARLAKQYPNTNQNWGGVLIPLQDEIAGPFRPALLILLAAVALVLLIACANVTNLMLGRGTLRTREMAIRASLGAGRARLVGQLLVEGAVLSLASATLGLAVAQAVRAGLVAAMPPLVLDRLPWMRDLSMDSSLVAASLGVAFLTVILAGLLPALASSKFDTRRFRRTHRLSGALVVAEAALAALLVVGAGLALRSLGRLLEVHPGFEPQRLLAMRVSLPRHKYSQRAQIIATEHAILERMRAIPRVQSAASAYSLPLASVRFSNLGIEGHPIPAWRLQSCEYYGASPGYFETIGAHLLRGRNLTENDGLNAPRVVVINESFAKEHFANEDPIGKRIMIWRASGDPREIVGVVRDIRQGGLDSPVRPTAYLPSMQDVQRDFAIVLRAERSPRALENTARSAVTETDRDIVTYGIMPMMDVLGASPSVALRRVPSLLVAVLAALAVLLAGVGIAGVLSAAVNRRLQEIGVRLALGASPTRVTWMVLRHSLRLVLLGLAMGLAVSLALSKLARSWVFGIAAVDGVAYASALFVLLAVAIAAAWLPARRASRIDPVVALRCD